MTRDVFRALYLSLVCRQDLAGVASGKGQSLSGQTHCKTATLVPVIYSQDVSLKSLVPSLWIKKNIRLQPRFGNLKNCKKRMKEILGY
jgi:hypothetical protein